MKSVTPSQKADAYDACESVARKRLAHILPELEAQIPRLCEINKRTWEQHRDHMPISALDMLEYAKLALKDERIATLEAALEPFADIDGEGSEDFPDDTAVTVRFGRTTHYALKLGDLRRARSALNRR